MYGFITIGALLGSVAYNVIYPRTFRIVSNKATLQEKVAAVVMSSLASAIVAVSAAFLISAIF